MMRTLFSNNLWPHLNVGSIHIVAVIVSILLQILIAWITSSI